jgi:hypothetical protein
MLLVSIAQQFYEAKITIEQDEKKNEYPTQRYKQINSIEALKRRIASKENIPRYDHTKKG